MGDGSFLQDQVFVGDLALADHIGGAGQIQVGDAAGRVTDLYLTGPTNVVCKGEITDENLVL